MVFTAAYHLKRGYCCGSGCRHCPYGLAAVAANWDQRLEPGRMRAQAEAERRRLAHQHRKTRKRKAAAGIVDHVQLAKVLAGLQTGEWHVEFDRDGVAAFTLIALACTSGVS